MNEKIKYYIYHIIIFIVIGGLFFYSGYQSGYQNGRNAANTRINELESELSDVLIINKELSEENTKHLDTIQRVQGLTDESTRRIQLLESGIAKLKGIGEAKDLRIVKAERRVRELSEEIEDLGRKVDGDAERITRLLEQFRSTSKDNLGRIDSDSDVMWSSHNFNINKVEE